ncbi:MAG: HAD family hydrolase [Verrucomicrobia bacterium]|nr:HAD family hydrolase [Verrucomicrobiota bacterium]MCH8527670.1 HAD family hydrolase [Kiritimatiellia bacterium]
METEPKNIHRQNIQRPVKQQALKALRPEKPFLIGVDSDGCVFDSMELKHKECFCPAFIDCFGFQAVGKPARETWEFVNLYSKTRGLNRFKAVVEAIRRLNERPEVRAGLGRVIATDELETWIASETRLSETVLGQYIQAHRNELQSDSILLQTLNWSIDVAEAVKKIIHDLPPIAEARTALEVLSADADCMVVSQTPCADLIREWNEHDITRFTRIIAGQEQGTKSEHLALAAGDKYAENHVLMIGDAPGDHQAAAENGFLFFPIVPGRERESWGELLNQGLPRLFEGRYAGAYQDSLLTAFHDSLPETPPWITHS